MPHALGESPKTHFPVPSQHPVQLESQGGAALLQPGIKAPKKPKAADKMAARNGLKLEWVLEVMGCEE